MWIGFILSHVGGGGCAWLIRRVLDCIIGFMDSAIVDLRTLQFTVTHALELSVFTSRILATDLSQSHCNFKSHMKSSCHSLIPFLTFLLNHLRLPSPELDPVLDETPCFLGTSRYIASGRTPLKTTSFIVPYCLRRVNWSVAYQ
jgi:hypothetical protein